MFPEKLRALRTGRGLSLAGLAKEMNEMEKGKQEKKKQDHNRGKKKTETVTIPKNPKNVIVMDYGALDIMQDLNLEDHITAILKGENGSFLPDYLSKFKDKKYTNLGNPGRPNFEKIAEKDPPYLPVEP